MNFRFIIGIALMGALVGCSTTKQPVNISHLQTRVSFIESQLDDQNSDIVQLKSSLEEISMRMPSRVISTKPVSKTQKTTQSSPSQISKTKNQQILRVPVTPQKVQIALQNAGYYNGAIDGKLGSGSKKAIKDFQKDHDLESDGIVGKKTWAELKNYLD